MTKIKLNYIQNRGYERYERTGRVLLSAPRRSGKTTILIKIIQDMLRKEHIDCIGIFALHKAHFNHITKQMEEMGLTDEEIKKVHFANSNQKGINHFVSDEVHPYHCKCKFNELIAAVWSNRIPILNFTWKDMNPEEQQEIIKLKRDMSEDQFIAEFGEY